MKIGDLYHDIDRVWCDGSDNLNVCYLVLSRDIDKIGDKYYRCLYFMWCDGFGYGGTSRVREFSEDELSKMKVVGNLSDIKSF